MESECEKRRDEIKEIVNGPAARPLTSYAAVISGSEVVVTLPA